ncbi:MAG: LON peptidase substrate-binding domain-containing protein [Gemmatimonadota bacterium]
MSRRLPIFALDVVLFPGAPLPLHIFESRYRQMIIDCLAGDERFGIVVPGPDGAVAAGAVGCMAHIRARQSLSDGRSNIVVSGESRFLLRGMLTGDTPYPVATIDEFEDDPALPTTDEIEVVRRRADRYREALRVLTDSPSGQPPWDTDPVAFSFEIAALLEVPLEMKQSLLETRSTPRRFELLRELLDTLTEAVTASAEVHAHSRTNGKGAPHFDIEPAP